MHEHTPTLAAAYFSNNQVSKDQIGAVLKEIERGLVSLDERDTPVPAVPIEDSVQDDFIVCLEDGKHLKMLKRYLNTNYGMTPDQYRAKWGLPDDYPMVCRKYSEKRSGIAKDQGLGKS